MDRSLVSGKALAEALGVSASAVSMAAKEGRPCKGEPVSAWARRGDGGRVRGYDVPPEKRKELGLRPQGRPQGFPQGEEEGDPPDAGRSDADLPDTDLAALVERVAGEVAERVARELIAELEPKIEEALRARLEARGEELKESGEEPSARRDAKRGGKGARSGRPGEREEEAASADATGEEPWRERLLRRLIEARGLERAPGGAAPTIGDLNAEEEAGQKGEKMLFSPYLRIFAESRRRLAAREGQVENTYGNPREGLYRILTGTLGLASGTEAEDASGD